jgi:MFS family permease
MALAGFTQAVQLVTWQPLVAEYGRERPGRALVTNQLVGAVVAFVTLIAGGQAIANLNYRDAFIGLGVISALCAVGFFFISRRFGQEQSEVVSLLRVVRVHMRRLVTVGFLMLTFVGLCLEPFNYLTVNQLFPNLARDAHAMLEGDISTLVAFARIPALISLFALAGFIDRWSAVRAYALGITIVGVCVVAMGQAAGVAPPVTFFLLYFFFQGTVWGSSAAAINAVVEPELRDSAFALTSIVMSVALFIVGFVHNRLLGAGMTLPQVFSVAGLIPIAAGLVLVAFSFRRIRAGGRLKSSLREPA